MSTIARLRPEPSELRSSASRVNGSKSRGPITEQGKKASRHNSRKHGLYSESLLLVNEDSEEFTNLKEGLCNSIQPEDEYEQMLVSRLANAHLRLNRVLQIEAEMMNLNLGQLKPSHFLFHNAQSTLNLILRYIASAERTIEKATRELSNHRKSKETKSKNGGTNPRFEVLTDEPRPEAQAPGQQKPCEMAKNEETNPSGESDIDKCPIPGWPTHEQIASGKCQQLDVDLTNLSSKGWAMLESAWPDPALWAKAKVEAQQGPKTITLTF